MARVTRDKQMSVSAAALYQAITQFENYPRFLGEVVSAKVLEKTEASAKVEFEIEVVKRFRYVLAFQMKPNVEVAWRLVESDFFKNNEGRWKLSAQGGHTLVHYELDVGFGFLVPGWISKKLTETSLPKMFESFEGEAKRHEKN